MQLRCVLISVGCALGLFVLVILCFRDFWWIFFLGGFQDGWMLCANCL